MIVVLVSAIVKSPSLCLTGQCKLLNAIMHLKKKQACAFAPGEEASSRAPMHLGSPTTHFERVKINEIKNRHVLMELHVNGFVYAITCP